MRKYYWSYWVVAVVVFTGGCNSARQDLDSVRQTSDRAERQLPGVTRAAEDLAPAEIKRRALNDASDKQHLRKKNEFVVDRSDKFLKAPDALAADVGFDRAKVAPTVRLQILPDLEPEYFPATNQYMACWANWAYVARSDENRFFMAASDHLGMGADINVYEYAPGDKEVRKRIDVDRLLGWKPDQYTDGKLHGQMGILSNGVLWGATQYGVPPDSKWYAAGYKGSWLFSYDLKTGEGQNWGSPLPSNSMPCFTVDTRRGLLVATAGEGGFLCWDCNAKQVKFAGRPPNGWIWWARSLLCDDATGIFWGMDGSEKPHRFMSYDPARNVFKRYDVQVPPDGANPLRGHTPGPAADGFYYWASMNGNLLKFKPGNPPVAESFGKTWDTGRDTLQLSLSPGGRYVYYFAKGHPTPVIQLDVKTGRKKALCWLQDYYFEKYGYVMGECYGMNITADGSALVACMNGEFTDNMSSVFGHPACLVIEIPKAERVE